MRRSIYIPLILFLAVFFTGRSYSQNYNWIIPNKTYMKMSVADDGIYRITSSDFNSAGINTTGIDPRTVKVMNKGQQIPIYFEGENDGVFNSTDYFDFYGTRNYGGIIPTYNENNTVVYQSNEYYNFYSDTNAYWIEWDGSNGSRMSISNFNSALNNPLPYYDETLHFEKDKIYWIGEYLNGTDFRNFTNEKFRGESWYWALLSSQQSLSDTFSIPYLYAPPQNSTVRVSAYPQNVSTSVLNEHTIEIRVNGNLINTVTVNDYVRIDTTLTFSSSLLSNSSVNTVTAKYIANGGFGGLMFFDLFEISYPKQYRFRSNQTLINTNQNDTASYKFKVSGYNQANPVFIYDVKNGVKINSFSNVSDTLIYSGKLSGKFEVINKNIVKKPFRIIQRQVPDYVSSGNNTDYLLIYNSLFQSQANQLASHREAIDNFRVTIADIRDIYDIFNYGIEDPVALRNFTRYVYNNWQLPRVRYICLFGRGSLDPKKNSSTTQYEKNLIPVIGNPSSDNYFANMNTSGFAFYTQVSIGRLPAYTPTEAQYMVDNIITYETQPRAEWNKSFTFIGGGADSVEQAIFLPLIDTLINPYIIPPSVSGNPVRIIREDLNGGQTFNYSDSIKNQINRGTSTVNFMGHAGSQDWEIGMRDPDVLTNYNGKFPLIFSMTCYTGKVGEPTARAFGEKFMKMQNRGAIGYLGTSGWGFVYAGSVLNKQLYQSIAVDSVRRIGDIISSALNVVKKDSSLFSARHTLNCYTLQGDPAVRLLLPRIPEYSISNNDYTISDKSPAIYEDVIFKAFPKNFGTHGDSCKIRFTLSSNAAETVIRDTTLRNFKFSDTVKFVFRIKKAGIYNLSLVLDQDNSNPNENRSDNTLLLNIETKEASFVKLYPVDNSYNSKDSATFIILNPFKVKDQAKLYMEYDTTVNFNSPLKKTFVLQNISGVTSEFKTNVISTDTTRLTYWRINYSYGSDTAGWSRHFSLRYNPGIAVNETGIPADNIDVNTSLFKNNVNQYSVSDYNNTYYGQDGIKLSEYTGNLYVRSLGSNGAEASYFSVLNQSIHMDAGTNTGLNLLKVRKLDGKILQHKNFKILVPQSSDSVLNFLNTFDSTHYLMGLNAAYSAGAQLLSSAVIAKFNQFGSTKIQLFRVGFFDTWSFIGYLNAPPGEVSEEVHPYNNAWIESVSSMNRTFKSMEGTVSYLIGPANTWKSFSWSNSIPPGSDIKFDVFGITKNEDAVLLYNNITTNNFTDLNDVYAYNYPKLNLVAKLRIDSLSGLNSPVLNSFRINYTLPAELVTESNSITQSDTAVKLGEEVKFTLNYDNAGFEKASGTVINIYKSYVSSQNLILSDTLNADLLPGKTSFYKGKFRVPYIRGDGQFAVFVLEVKAKNKVNEFYSFNNLNYLQILINLLNNNPAVEIFSDGQKLSSGDFVSLKPELRININAEQNNDNKFNKTDTSDVSIILNDKYIPFYNNGSENSILKKTDLGYDNASDNIRSFIFKPELLSGQNRLKISYRNGSESYDTTVYDFSVSDEILVKDLYNFPNPMKGETQFVFNLLGSEVPSVCKIRIYTLAGRLIKEIIYSPAIGYNQIPWDGRDNDGDYIANGTYLYKFIVEDGGYKETATQKLVVLR
ncbi:MAG TPA: C25 family cysteine peptidase [Ignavibacteria bacterium]|nr:C25 family cysteine peptidase [Ignavibacteria bacterium]HMR39054.1 C25 family cysteine peptidase [Ignavibacteria bacterium]